MTFARYVAVGDSQTEGLNDGDGIGGHRGWADRLAEHIAGINPDLHYANLAVRGHLTADIRRDQLQPALALRPDLVTVMAGMNDLIRPRFDAEAVTADLEAMYAALTRGGAHVVTNTFPDLGKITPLARPLRPRVTDFNARIRAAAARHGVTVLDSFAHAIVTDPRLWDGDRLHANPLGHTRIAAGMAHVLELPGSDDTWTHPLEPLPPTTVFSTARTELKWITRFVLPWLARRALGRSSGDGRSAKRPELAPVSATGSGR